MARAAQQRHRPVRGPAFLSSPERALVWAYAQQHGPNEPHDEDELANLRWHAAAFVRRAQKVFADGGVRLYRAVLLPRRWPWRETLRLDRLGLYWSFRRAGARVYYTPNGDAAGDEAIPGTVLVGRVESDAIDWPGSLLAFLNYGEDESEARLVPGARVQLLAVGREALRAPVAGSSGPSNARWRPNPSQSEETSTEVYRGTQLPGIGGLRRGLSFTPVLFVAAIYAARPGTPVRFVPGSTLHRATHTGRVLVLPDSPTLGMDDVLSALGYGKPDGITGDEVRKIFNYLHNRQTGKAPGGAVEVAVLDEDGEPREEEDLGIDLFSHMSPSLVFRDEWDDDPSPELAGYFRASTYGFVDSPSFQAAALRLGYGAVIYADFFEGGIRAAEELFGCDIYDIDGIGEGETINGESVPTHPTLRILDPSQIHDATTMQIESVLPSIRCR